MPACRIGDLTFDYDDEGPREAPVVLLLHGFPEDRSSWDRIADGLQRAGYRTVRPDQRGYSPGARPGSIDDYRLGSLVADAVGLLDELGIDRAHVVGHDWGGAVAWGIASAHPERVLTLTSLSTPHPAAMRRAMLRGTQALRSWYMGMFQVPGLAERLLAPGGRMWAAIMRGLPREAKERYSANARRPGALTAMVQWYRALPRDLARPSIDWRRIEVPTLYVWGARDPALGETAARMTGFFVHGPYTFVILPREGHWLPELAADEVLHVLLPHLQGSTGR